MADGIGLSVGATALRAVAIGRSAVTRSPVLTRYPHRPAEVGVPSENPNLTERGLIITDFVDRVGDPVPIVAPDGSSHRAESLLAEALRSLLAALTGGRPPTEPVGVTHPAHWGPAAVEALRRELDGMTLGSDATAALTALRDDPGVPSRGVVALCDVGGTGTSITLADAANGFAPIGPTVRHPDFSGDLVDQALLTRIVGDLAASGSVDLSSTSAIGNLNRLRGQCRAAKERLSTSASASVTVDLPGRQSEIRITRAELDEAVREPLAGLLDAVQDTLQRSGIRPGDLVAVATAGGGALIPALVTSLSEHLRVPVVTSARPELAAAIGGGLSAARGLVPDDATAMAPAAVAPIAPLPPVDQSAPASSTFRALAWSDAEHIPEPEPATQEPDVEYADPRPPIAFVDDEDDAAEPPPPWYRTPAGIIAAAAAAVLVAVGTAGYLLLRDDESPASTPATTTQAPPPSSEVNPPPAEPPAEVPPEQPAPEQTVVQQAPPPPVTVTREAPPPPATTTEAPPPTTEAPPPTTTTEAPPTTTQPPQTSTTQPPAIPTLPYQTIPGLPFVPSPFQPQQP
ncbi:molecular chaperone [Mycobacterium sp. Root135]|uniref:Hsp70 family protein n=1 Tax=Mycobacterium sp. Root135 TaxID=1736457 RepID=UPI000701719B|nr:Hsp70 family protein [Mycobacterium sp. Root135]KQY06127.1 molecular chaperone [Mycobacterium sp. Root135]